jgi:hypothetical protein
MATIKKGTYWFNLLLDSCGLTQSITENIEFYNTLVYTVSEEDLPDIKEDLGIEISAGVYKVKRKCGGIRLSFTADNHYRNWVDYLNISFVSVDPYVEAFEKFFGKVQDVDIVYDSWDYPYDYYTEVDVFKYWDSEKVQGCNIITITQDQDVTDDFYTWFTANANRLTLIFTKLNVGDAVASSGGKCFKRLTTQPTQKLEAGLYDEDDNLVASWDMLVNTYGMDCEKDYTNTINASDSERPCNVLAKLSNGTKLIIGNSVTSIGSSAFYNCTNLSSIVIPDSVTSIGDYAFSGCDSLRSAVIGNSVTRIYDYAFYNCTNLKDVYYTGSEADWAKITICSYNDDLTNATIHYNYAES